jgi:3-phosphoshikimate 1-carboxyvinyltransferase
MTRLVVHPVQGPLRGSVPVPSDKSIGHRALLFGALANGVTRIRDFSRGEDNLSTAACLRAMGIVIEDVGPTEVHVHGKGIFGLEAPKSDLDCGNSGTTMRLLCGVLAAQPFASTLVGDASLTKRPMNRIAVPLRRRGARIDGAPHPKKEGEITAPLRIAGLADGEHLTGLEFESPVSSAQVKSAMLLSGLYAHGPTFVREPYVSRDHSERMLQAIGAPLRAMGPIVQLDPAGWDGKLAAMDLDLPGDISAAAFLLVAGTIVDGSEVMVRFVGTNPTRTGILDMLRDMGAPAQVEPLGDRAGEPIANLVVGKADLSGRLFGGEMVARAIDEVPILCALAARARGTTTICDAKELRVKESDRIAAMARVLRSFGVACEEREDGLVIEGREGPLTACRVDCEHDHRIAMSAAVLALLGDGPTTIDGAEVIATSFPKFVATLRALGARVDVVED